MAETLERKMAGYSFVRLYGHAPIIEKVRPNNPTFQYCTPDHYQWSALQGLRSCLWMPRTPHTAILLVQKFGEWKIGLMEKTMRQRYPPYIRSSRPECSANRNLLCLSASKSSVQICGRWENSLSSFCRKLHIVPFETPVSAAAYCSDIFGFWLNRSLILSLCSAVIFGHPFPLRWSWVSAITVFATPCS